ncbi:MAG: hypothetical protein AAAC47_29700 [Pararhizobium sp.]
MSLRTIHCRLLVLILAQRGFSRHKLAEVANISPPSLLRLSEFGSALDPDETERLLATGAALLDGKVVSSPPIREKHPRHSFAGV